MDDAQMNHILEASEFPGGDLREPEAAAAKPAAIRLPWDNYVRCLLLTAIIGMVGYMAWRPSMLRLSALRALVSPSHGDSLAWKPSEEATLLVSPILRTPSPDEWRLTAGHGAENWQTVRPGAERFSLWRGARMSRPQWKRFSANPWNWQNDSAFGTRRKPDASAQPAQKPATSFRARGVDTWTGTEAAPARSVKEAPVSIPEAITVPALGQPPIADRGSFDRLPPLEIPSLSPTNSLQPSLDSPDNGAFASRDNGDMPVPSGLSPVKAEESETPKSAASEPELPDSTSVKGAEETESEKRIDLPFVPGERDDAPAATTPATEPATSESSVDAVEDVEPGNRLLSAEAIRDIEMPAIAVVVTEDAPDDETGSPEPAIISTVIDLPDEISAATNVSASAEPDLPASPAPSGEAVGSGSLRPRETPSASPQSHSVAIPDQSRPSALRPQPAAAGQTPATAAPATANADTEEIDWATREITEAIPGAYLTIYPKLKFVGLCVPGQNYIRKYNQVAVPRDLAEPKMNSLDGRTPYGKYYIAGHRRDIAGARLILSWPSPDDARRVGLPQEMVTEIENTWLKQSMPPQTTAAGGGVYLTGMRNMIEETDGSFALEDAHLEEIFTALPDGAWVFIQE